MIDCCCCGVTCDANIDDFIFSIDNMRFFSFPIIVL